MPAEPRLILDDIARIAGGAVNVVSGVRQQIRDEVKARVEEMATRLNLVPREDLDILQARIDKLQSDYEDLEKRLEALEGKKPAKKTEKPAKSASTKTKKAKK